MQATHFDRDAVVALCSDLDGRSWGEREGRGGEGRRVAPGAWDLRSVVLWHLGSRRGSVSTISDLNPIEI